MNEKFNILISTDIIGMFGKIETFKQIYGPDFNKIEIITWAPTLDAQISQAKSSGYEIVRLHGRLYCPKHPKFGLHALILYGGNYLLTSTPTLIKKYAAEYDILLHTPVYDDKQIIDFTAQYKDSIRQLWIENHGFGKMGAAKAVHLVNTLRRHGIRAGLCLDLAHFIGAKNLQATSFSEHWKLLLEYTATDLLNLKDDIGENIPISLHFPIGTEPGDSLPIEDKLSVAMIKEFVSIIKGSRLHLITLENQNQGKISYFKINEKLLTHISERNKKIVEKLQKAGLIDQPDEKPRLQKPRRKVVPYTPENVFIASADTVSVNENTPTN